MESTHTWDITAENGEETVYIQLRDRAGNLSEVYSVSVSRDTSAPQGNSMAINSPDESANGETITYVNNRKIKIHLDVSDITENDFMMVSEDKDFEDAEWEPYQDNFSYKLDDKEGKRHVYIKFKDQSGNISDTISRKVVLDTTDPKFFQISINEILYTKDNLPKLVNLYIRNFGISGKTEEKSKIKLFLDGISFKETEADENGKYNFGNLYFPNGTHELRVEIKDRAKNKAEIILTLDIQQSNSGRYVVSNVQGNDTKTNLEKPAEETKKNEFNTNNNSNLNNLNNNSDQNNNNITEQQPVQKQGFFQRLFNKIF